MRKSLTVGRVNLIRADVSRAHEEAERRQLMYPWPVFCRLAWARSMRQQLPLGV